MRLYNNEKSSYSPMEKWKRNDGLQSIKQCRLMLLKALKIKANKTVFIGVVFTSVDDMINHYRNLIAKLERRYL